MTSTRYVTALVGTVSGVVAAALATMIGWSLVLHQLTAPEQHVVLAGIAVWAIGAMGMSVARGFTRTTRTLAGAGHITQADAAQASGRLVRETSSPWPRRLSGGDTDALAEVGRFVHAAIADRPGCEQVDAAAAVFDAGTRWPAGMVVNLDDLHELVGGTAPVTHRRLVDELESLPAFPTQRRQRSDRHDQRRFAVHEAGHAIVAAVTGTGFLGATLLPGADEGSGLVAGTCWNATNGTLYDRAEIVATIATSLAGIEAERLLLDEISDGGDADVRNARRRARRLARCDGTDTTDTLLTQGRALAVRTLHQHHAALRAAAEHLQQHQRLGTTTLTRLINDDSAPLATSSLELGTLQKAVSP